VTIALIGHTTVDTVTAAGTVAQVRPGGAPLYGRRALLAAGADPVVIAKGDGAAAALVLDWSSPVLSVLVHGPDGLVQRLDSVGDPFTAEEVRGPMAPLLAGCRWVVLGAQSAGDFPPDMIAALAEAGLRVCLDGQGLARGGAPGPVRLRSFPAQAVAGVHVLKLNIAEARAFGDVDQLRDIVPELLVTDGPRGAQVLTAAGTSEAPGSGRPFADPTGAGDSFLAGYALARERGLAPTAAAAAAVELVERLYSA
jgi:hypothetical protein